ncbi:hypothetical protein IV203_000461 [Nitzschia inconspicua]|uniref:Uncharacterized protein n=1 Tax=Nitzschia inconspicua TaxID=303405 RepID=A0A9K3L4V5_9STRA|nr:hypothetical protein IV203_000461 [Nitzschia inconspicua]
MSGSDDDFIPTEAPVDSRPAHNLRRRPSEHTSEVVPPRSAKKARYEPKTTQSRIPTNLRSIVTLKKSLSKKLMGTDITENLSLRVFRAAFLMQENYLLEKRKTSTKNGRKVKPAKIQARICELFGISTPTYCAILSNYLKDRTAYASGKFRDGRSGNRSVKETRIPDTLAVQILVRDFIRGKRAKRERVTARQVLDHLVSVNIISVETGEDGVMIPKAFANKEHLQRRSVQKWQGRRGDDEKMCRNYDQVDSEDDDEGDSEDDHSEISDGTDLEKAPPDDVEEPWTEMEEV